MKLILDRLDLMPEHEGMNCSQIKIHHFKKEVQEVVGIIGRATFREYDGSGYRAVFAPALMTWVDAPDIKQIGGKLVGVQACWLADDGTLVANVQVIDGGEVVYSQRIQIKDDGIADDDRIPFKRQGRQMTREEFSTFLNDNFTAVSSFVTSLLTSAETASGIVDNVHNSIAPEQMPVQEAAETVSDIDSPRCDNCLKFLDDPTHQWHEERRGYQTQGEYFTDPVLVDYGLVMVCDEPKRQECSGGCERTFEPKDLIFEEGLDGICEQCLEDWQDGAWDD